jgi:MFS family permease
VTASNPPADRPSLLRHPDFLKLWVGDTISQFGSQISFLAIPLTAAVLLGAAPFEMGLLGTIEMLPFLLISLPAGVWVDRLPRRRMLISGDLVRAVALGTIPTIWFLQRDLLGMPWLYLVAIVGGTATVFFDAAYQAYLPSLVERSQLIEGNTKLEISRSTAQLTGPGFAGVLISLLSAPLTIALDSVSFAISALSVGLIGKVEPRPDPKPADQAGGMIAEIREGLGVITGSPILRSIAACTSTSNLGTSIAFAAIFIFLTKDLQLDAARIGVIFAIGNVGGLVGALIAGRVPKVVGTGPAIVGSALFGSALLWLNAAATPQTAFPILILTGLMTQIGNQVYNINQVSLRQAITPDRLQGRMNASMRFIVWGTIPVGAFTGGILGTVIGVRQGLLVGSIIALTAWLWVFFSPVRKLREPPAAWRPDAAEAGVEPGGESAAEPWAESAAEPVFEVPPIGGSGQPPD